MAAYRLSALEEDFMTALGGEELYGLELMARINLARSKFGFRSLGVGSLYPTLDRMVSYSLILRSDRDNKTYYRLSEFGHHVLSKCQSYRLALAIWDDGPVLEAGGDRPRGPQ